MMIIITIIIIIIIYLLPYLPTYAQQLSFQSVAVVPTPVQTKHITIKM